MKTKFKILAIATLSSTLFIMAGCTSTSSSDTSGESTQTSGEYVNPATVEGDVQKVTTSLDYGYEPITVQVGVPVEWTVQVNPGTLNDCINAFEIPEFGVTQELVEGENVIKFTPTETGTYEYTCWMGMQSDEIIVVDEL